MEYPITYIHITGLPVGQLTKQKQHDFAEITKAGFGRNDTSQPIANRHFRPNAKTVYSYDEEGEITGIISVATHWLFVGDYSGEGWTTDEEARDSIAITAAAKLGVPVGIFHNPHIIVERLTWEEANAMRLEDPGLWGDTVGG